MTIENSTGFKGVIKKGNKYGAIGWAGRYPVYLGYFNTADAANDAYKAWVDKGRPSNNKKRRLSDYYEETGLDPDLLAYVEDVFFKLRK